MNEVLLRDGCEAIALVGRLRGDPSTRAVRLWLQFADTPTPSCWYRAHNASVVAGYLEHESRAAEETAPERFFMNVALVRVLYAHTLVAAPRLALGRAAPVGRVLGDPRLGMVGAFLSLRRVVPNQYPLTRDVEWYIADEQRLGRLLDYAVIVQGCSASTSGPRVSSATRVCLGSFAKAARSTPGRTSCDTCGVPSACRSRASRSRASRGLADLEQRKSAAPAGAALFVDSDGT